MVNTLGIRILVGGAVLLSTASFGYVVYRATCATCGKSATPQVGPAADVSDEGNARVDRIANHITAQDRLGEEDAQYLRDTLSESDEIVVQRWALASMAEHLRKGSEMSEATRALLVDTIVGNLSGTNQRLVICAIACSEQAGLVQREDVRQKIVELRDDGNPHIAARATRSPLPGDGV